MRRSQGEEITIVKVRGMNSVILVGGLKKKILYMKQKIKTGHKDNPSTIHEVYLNCRALSRSRSGREEIKASLRDLSLSEQIFF